MELKMGTALVSDLEQQNEEDSEKKIVARVLGFVETTERAFRNDRLDEIVRNLSYYRGQFWEGDGIVDGVGGNRNYRAVRNEIFPIVDTIVSALAMDLPQVEALDRRENSHTQVERTDDPTFAGRRISSVLNWVAEKDELDTTVQELVLNALLFGEGIVKASWSTNLGRPIWRIKMPWEVHFDSSARQVRDAAWSFERFVIHWDDFQQRVDSEVYSFKKEIKPDTYPRNMVSEKMRDRDYEELRRAGLKEYIGLIEYWDYRQGLLFHIHPETKQVLMSTEVPFKRPYTMLVFNSGVGRIRGISDVSLIAPLQRDINELVTARREIVSRLPRRMLVDEGLFNSEEEFERWKNAKTWEPTRVRFPVDASIDERVWVSPEMPTTFDFNRHLEDNIEAIRWTPGMSDFQRGEVKNIRTAAEADMVRSAVEGRLKIRTQKLIRVVTQLFKDSLEVLRWAIENDDESNVNMEQIVEETVMNVEPELLANEILNESIQFRLLPFSPLMEDRIARRDSLTQLLPALVSEPLASSFNFREIAKEIVDVYGWRPSVVNKSIPGEEAAAEKAIAEMAMEEEGPPPGLAEVLG